MILQLIPERGKSNGLRGTEEVRYMFNELIPNNWYSVIVVFQALGKQLSIQRPELYFRGINSLTIIDVNNCIS